MSEFGSDEKMLISVVTYTYNRADILKNLLESICSQTLDPESFEFIVVDNHSTDRTKSLVELFCSRCNNFRYVFEEKIGTSLARNRGWQEAKGEYIAFIDDDGKAPPDWLDTAMVIIQEMQPDVFGGPVLPYYTSPKPIWFQDKYATISKGELARPLESNEFLSGSNLFIRREILEAVKGFDQHLGPHGTSFGYGEETDLQRRIRAIFSEGCIWYEPKFYNYHLFREEKFSLLWQARAKFALGRFSYLVFSNGKHQLELRHLLGVLFMPFKIAYLISFGLILRDRNKFPYPQNYYFEKSLNDIRIFGKLIERLRQTIAPRIKIIHSRYKSSRDLN
jgi:glycosyltransferase involved in cell wall biosynthesis